MSTELTLKDHIREALKENKVFAKFLEDAVIVTTERIEKKNCSTEEVLWFVLK